MNDNITKNEAQSLIDALTAAHAKRPPVFSSVGLTRHEEEHAFARHRKACAEWERTIWNPAAEALRKARIEVKWDYISSRYYPRYDATGKEVFAVRVSCTRHYDVMVAAADSDEAKYIATKAMNHEPQIARRANAKARFTFETTAQDTSALEEL